MDRLEVEVNVPNPARKRGPGRPKLAPATPELKIEGVVDTPDDAANRAEFLYRDPTTFKDLFNYFKNIKARNIHIFFRKAQIAFMTRDHSRSSRVIAYIDCTKTNWYYCAEEFRIGINLDNYEKLFCSIGKSEYKITFICRHDDHENITILLKDSEVGKEHASKMKLSDFEPDEELFEAEECLDIVNFPLEFTVNSKSFKSDIANASDFSDFMTIEKVGNYPLQYTYNKVNVGVFSVTFDDSEKIKLRSDVEADCVFKCKLKLSHTRAIAKSLVTNNITILCKETEDILFRSNLEGGILVVNTFVKLAEKEQPR
jgi:hypothetical protein